MPPSKNKILLVVALCHGSTHFYTAFLQPLNPELKIFFDLTLDRHVTFFATVYLCFYALSNLIAGLMAPRFSPAALLAGGSLLNGIVVSSLYLLPEKSYNEMCVLTALYALGGGIYHPVANMLLTETFPNAKGRALGISGIGASLAFIISPWGAETLVRMFGWHWQQVCLLYGCVGIAIGLAAWMVLPHAHSQHASLPASTPVNETTRASPVRNDNSTGATVTLRAIFMFMIFYILAIGAREIGTWGGIAVTRQFGDVTYPHDPPQAGMLIACLFFVGLLVQPLAGLLSDRWERERVLALTFGLQALAWYLVPFTSREWLVPLFLLLGAAMTASVPTAEALIADRTPFKYRSLFFGIAITSAIGLGALGPWLTGAIADHQHRSAMGYRNALHALAALMLLACLLALFLKRIAEYLKLGIKAKVKN